MNSLFAKLKFYQRAIRITLFCNVLVVVMGLVAGLFFYSRIHNVEPQIIQGRLQLEGLHQLQSDALTALKESMGKDEYGRRRSQEILGDRLKAASDEWPSIAAHHIPLSAPQLHDLLQTIQGMQLKTEQMLGAAVEKSTHFGLELFIIGMLTFLLGFLIPAFVIRKITKKIGEVRRQAEHAVRHWIGEYILQIRSNSEPFKSPEFWLRMAIVTAEAVAEYWEHPVLNWIHEMGPTLREELSKISDTAKQDEKPSGDVRPLKKT